MSDYIAYIKTMRDEIAKLEEANTEKKELLNKAITLEKEEVLKQSLMLDNELIELVGGTNQEQSKNNTETIKNKQYIK